MNNKPTHIYTNGKIKELTTEVKKQSSWFKTDDDIKFENSFKFWFALQWQNKYLQIFAITFITTIIEICKFGWVIDTVYDNYSDEGTLGVIFTVAGLLLPITISAVIAYKGFWQYFQDLKKDISR